MARKKQHFLRPPRMTTMNPLEIKDIKSEEITNLVATVKTRSLATKWSSDKSSGNKIAGVLSDNSASIDFICWSEGTKKFDSVLKKDKTYEFTSVKVQKAKGSYCKSNHSFQIVLDGKTEIKEVNCDPLIPPLVITSISSLKNAEENVKINVIGKVIQLPNIDKLPSSGTPVIRARIQDNTGSIIYSLLGQETQKCNFSINDVLFLEGTEMKIYGSLRLLQGNKGERTVNPTNFNCQNYLPSNDSSTSSVDLSPPKDMPVEKTESLSKDDGRQKLTCTVQSCNLKDSIYDRCPRQSCRRRVIFLQQSNVYKCNECETEYLVTATGIRLILTITKEEKNSKKLILFNEMAENFIKTTAKKLSMTDEKDIENMEQEIMSSTYTFVASPKKGDMNEYLVESFLETITCSEKANCSTVQEAPIEKKNQNLFRPYQLPEKTPEKGNISEFPLSQTPSVESLPYQPLNLESPSTITDMSCFLSPPTRHFMASPSTSMSLPPYQPLKLHTPSGMQQTYTGSQYAIGSYEQSVRCLPKFKGIPDYESDANNNSNMLSEDNSHGSFNMSYMFDATVKPGDAHVQNISRKVDDKDEESTGMTGVHKSYKFVKRRLDYD